MKTLEEKAKEAFVILGDKYFNILKETNPRGDFKHFIKMAVEHGFRHGYKAAFEWISVDDELPKVEKTPYQVLGKNIMNGQFETYFIEYSNKNIKEECTHWRPIND